jgi:CBS-domain-containing membrane protein
LAWLASDNQLWRATMDTKREALAELSTLRDAARVRAHLLGLEARERWTVLEAALLQAEHKLEQGAETLSEAVRDAGHDLFQSVRAFIQVDAGLSAPARLVMTSPVMTCSPLDDVNDVAQLFWDTNCGSLPVVDAAGLLQGMLTDRDICMAAYTQGRRLPDISVDSAMSRCVHAVSPDDTLQRVLEIMADVQVHHVPVVDDSRKVVGIISITDVARWVQSSPKRSDELRAAALSAVVAISAPATAIAPATVEQ